jgi:xanthine/CO dehydrogenase XdhC/CoxF family maturation factor
VALPKKKLKMFHASVQVTRIEDWCVEAATAQEARDLLASGQGERLRIGDCVYLEVADVSD